MEETIELDLRFFRPEENMYKDCWKVQAAVKFKVRDFVTYYVWYPFDCDKKLTKEEITEKINLKKNKLIELAKQSRELDESGFWWVE